MTSQQINQTFYHNPIKLEAYDNKNKRKSTNQIEFKILFHNEYQAKGEIKNTILDYLENN